MKSPLRCPSCHGDDLEHALDVGQLPRHPASHHRSVSSAIQAPRVELRLQLCADCGMLHRAPQREAPPAAPDGARHAHSTPGERRPRQVSTATAHALGRRFALAGADAIEIGSDDDGLLRDLARHHGAHCVGFRGARLEQQHATPQDHNLHFVDDAFSPIRYEDCRADLVICRSMLDHSEAPRSILSDVRQAMKPGGHFYVEVLDSIDQFTSAGVWSLRTDRAAYFHESTLRELLRTSGLEPTRTYRTSNGQRLCVEGEACPPRRATIDREQRSRFREQVAEFGQTLQEHRILWNDLLACRLAGSRTAATWGSGTHTVNFLNSIPNARGIGYAVEPGDSPSEDRIGQFVAGTGQRIVTPARLRDLEVDVLLLVGDRYRHEAEAWIRDLGLRCDVLVA